MTKHHTTTSIARPDPILKTAAQMAQIAGIGENKLRELMDNRELEYLPIGNRRLLTVQAILDYYARHKVPVHPPV